MNINSDNIQEKALDLTRMLLKLSFAGWVEGSQIEDVLKSFEIEDLQQKIYFLTALTVFVRSRMPENTFSSNEAQESLIGAIQERLDAYIMLEDADE